MCKTDEKTRQYYFFTSQQNVLHKEAEKIGFAKTHDDLLILPLENKNETKYNGISFLYYDG